MPPLLTIVVPTYNRHPLLLRLLRYYQDSGAAFPMRILDSSHVPPADSRLQALLRLPMVQHVRFDPNIPPTVKMAEGIRAVTTPYVVLWADDDLMVPRALAAAVQVLQAHPDVSAVGGVSGVFQVAVDGAAPVVSLQPYRQRAYTDEPAAARLVGYLSDYTTLFYAVHRTPQLAEHFTRCLSYGFGDADPSHAVHRGDWWIEVVLACLAIIRGKARQVDTLYMLRDRHAGSDSWERNGHKVDWFDWVTSPTFSAAYQRCCACLSDALAEQDQMSRQAAEAAVKQAFWGYLSRELRAKWTGTYALQDAGLRRRLRRMAGRVPGLPGLWRTVRAAAPGRAQGISLETLQAPWSPYHADFLPLYRAITTTEASA